MKVSQFTRVMVEREIEGDVFIIRSDKPGVRVSWQVTGIRHDPWALAHRIVVEKISGTDVNSGNTNAKAERIAR
jgi:hypothetical protein